MNDVMLHILPVEISLQVLSYLPIPSLCSLPAVSRQWFNFSSANQSAIFCRAAILHGYAQPGTTLLEDALSVCRGSPWEGAADWKDFCRRSVQLRKNWEGHGRVVARLITPPIRDVHRIKVDERVGICITTHIFGGLFVTHLFSNAVLWSLPQYYVRRFAHCEYERGYLVFDCTDGQKEVWRLASDFAPAQASAGADEVAPYAPPNADLVRTSALVAAIHGSTAPRGHFRPWAKLSSAEPTVAYRLAYPTLVSAGEGRAFLHDVRTGALVQTVEIDVRSICYVDVDERYLFVCGLRALHVFSRAGTEGEAAGAEVLRVPNDIAVRNVVSTALHVPHVYDDYDRPFVEAVPLRTGTESDHPRPTFVAAHVSRDGRDLVVLTSKIRVLVIRDFERICRGEISLEDAGQIVRLSPRDKCHYLAFEHGRVCIASVGGLYIFTVDRDTSIDSLKVVLVRPFLGSTTPQHAISCMQLTDRRIYFTWDEPNRRDLPLYEDDESAPEPSSPRFSSVIEPLGLPWIDFDLDPEESTSVGCIDFSLLPES
ncbi:hypothetical protein BC827DRAFT_1199936 [Russula dissimulans]|nr:hypothetical protein BC827DRAFT_1199936 [Russula dissimulans]